ncbi:integrase/recombinase XerD [Bacillus fengqiuensis]|nr:integrase/recombinase XerD [Bacillus fengqiuensis]
MENSDGGSASIIEPFCDWLKKQQKTENTIKTYSGVLNAFYKWMISRDISIEMLTKDHIEAYLHEMEAEGKSAATIGKALAALSIFVRFMGKPHLVQDVHSLAVPSAEDNVPDGLKREERDRLLQAVKKEGNLRDIAIVYVLLHTGIRVSELCQLNHNDVIQRRAGNALAIRESNGKIKRMIPLSTGASEHLNRYRSKEKVQKDALFISSVGQRISTRAVQYMLKKYGVNPHKLRHTFCYELIQKGVDLATVAQLAGHSDINVTKRYIQMTSNTLEEAIDRAFA